MRQSVDRILTSHVGSLPRSQAVTEVLFARAAGKAADAAGDAVLASAVAEVVERQVGIGLDVVSDGEFSKGRNWAFYVHSRISGISTRPATPEEMKDPLTSAHILMDRLEYFEV